jgi:hypothetical protein
MPTDKDFKRLVRARMGKTGEAYTTARASLRPDPDPGSVSGSRRGRPRARPRPSGNSGPPSTRGGR